MKSSSGLLFCVLVAAILGACTAIPVLPGQAKLKPGDPLGEMTVTQGEPALIRP